MISLDCIEIMLYGNLTVILIVIRLIRTLFVHILGLAVEFVFQCDSNEAFLKQTPQLLLCTFIMYPVPSQAVIAKSH